MNFLHFNPSTFVNINNSLTLQQENVARNRLTRELARKSIMSVVEETESVATRFSINSHTWATFFIFIQHFQLAHERRLEEDIQIKICNTNRVSKIDKYNILEYECLLNFNL